MATMRSVPRGREPGDLEVEAFAELVDRPLLVVGNGPSAAMPRHDAIPADAVVFRMNWFFLEDSYHLGRHVDAWFSAIPHERMERMLAEEVRTGRYVVDRLAGPVRVASHRDTDRWGNAFSELGLGELDSWAPTSRHARLARYFMSRPGLPTTGMQALAFGLAVGFRDVYLTGIDLYESRTARYGFTLPEVVQASLQDKDMRPGYEDAHGVDLDLAFLRACLTEFPDAQITNLCASEALDLYLPGPRPLVDRPAMSPETVPLLGEPKARALVVPGERTEDGAVLEIREPAPGRPWAEVDGRRCAYVTVVSGDYHHGARALAGSLRAVSDVPLIALCTPEVDTGALLASGIHVVDVPAIRNSRLAPGSTATAQARFAATFTKLHAFRLDTLDRVVYVDADAVVLRSIDDLFAGDDFAAVPDAGLDLPDGRTFNSGVFAVTPSRALFDRMIAALPSTPSADGGDQGFLNAFLETWRPLPLEYNTTKRIFSHHSALYDEEDVRVLHYVGVKPWQPAAADGRYDELELRWLDFLRPWELRELVRDLRSARAAGADGGGVDAAGGSAHARAKAAAAVGRWDEVERILVTAWHSREPTGPELRQLARAYRHQGRFGDSLAALRRARALQPASASLARELRNAQLRASYHRVPIVAATVRRLPGGRGVDEALR